MLNWIKKIAPALFLALFALSSEATAQPNNQIQIWSGSSGGWQSYDPPGTGDTSHDIEGSDLVDTRTAQHGDWFEWKKDGKSYRIKKDKITSEKMGNAFQKAADEDVNTKVVMDKDGKFKRIELRDVD